MKHFFKYLMLATFTLTFLASCSTGATCEKKSCASSCAKADTKSCASSCAKSCSKK